MNKLLLLALLLAPLAATGQVYKTTDEQGNVVFTDQPPADSRSTETIEISPTNTAAPPADIYHTPENASSGETEATSYLVDITSPAHETSIPMGPGNFSVSASVNPALTRGERLQLFLDGAPHGDPQVGASWHLSNVFRGAHEITVAVVGGNGERLATSDPITVYVHRPSVNFRRNR